MSFTPQAGAPDRSFELVRQSLLQSDDLPFADALKAEQIRQAFDAEGVSFGEPTGNENEVSDGDSAIVYTMSVTLWAMLSQALFTDVQRACRAAVQRVAVYYALLGIEVSSTNTGAYSRARAKVTEGVIHRLVRGVAERCEAAVPDEWRWNGFRTMLVDGTTFSMPDTTENQEEYPQAKTQAEGLGFPILRAVALISLATGMIHDLAMGPYAGKQTGETALFRTLFDNIHPGDLVVADRYYTGWFTLALLQDMKVEFVSVLHQLRDADFRQGKRLGPKDHVVKWAKPPQPKWLDQESYDRLPEELEVREIQVTVEIPGFRTESLILVTSLREASRYSRNDIAHLYRQRWLAELHLREIKSTMQLDILRRKTPAAVRQELWTGLLAYNLVRQSILQSALAGECRPQQLSFAATLQILGNTWVLAAVPPTVTISARERLIVLRIVNGHSHRVGNRPNRIEPRAVKRRPAPVALLTELRETARAKLIAGTKA